MIAPYFCIGVVDAEQVADENFDRARAESGLVASLLGIVERLAKLLGLHASHA
jgi:hypothetical protein